MGKKVKAGKARKDKFYELAKTEGYRSRAAYKLLQLDGKFNFLSSATVCIDLCAAPGGWLQAAKKRMPVSSIIIGVDLHKIRPIPTVHTFIEDITTDKCKQTIRGVLHDRKANVVLHDGAPNVGKSWIHDAYQQALLTLSALKLAVAFLDSGGYFVTKVFRSRDYNALLWVFGQMFKKVHSTKPQASRNESAEIFVICQGYMAPDEVDSKFFDPKFVFKDFDPEPKYPLNLVHPEKQSRKAGGYAESEIIVEHKLSAQRFITNENYLELLRSSTEIVLDDEWIINHKATSDEIKACVKDLQVLGKKDIRNILTWHKRLKKSLAETGQSTVKLADEVQENSVEEGKEEDQEENELRAADEFILQQLEEKDKEIKRRKKQALRVKRKLREKMKLNIVIPGDRIVAVDDIELFNLKTVSSQIQQKNMSHFLSESDNEEKEEFNDMEDSHSELEDEKQISSSQYGPRDIARKYDASDSDTENNTDSELSKGRKINDFDSVAAEPAAKNIKLNPYELAIGEEMIKSQKRRRELIEMSYNRYVANDDGLPDWFVKDERLHRRKQAPITKEQIQVYKEKQKAIDAQPIKKIAEARARKKRKLEKRLEKARKKAEAVTDKFEMSEIEKRKAEKEVYKKAGLLKSQKRHLTYVVAKKHTSTGKRAIRPDGVKGHYRLVDPRLKKDKRKQKLTAKQKKTRR